MDGSFDIGMEDLLPEPRKPSELQPRFLVPDEVEKYTVKETDDSEDSVAENVVLTDNLCTACDGVGLWSCQQCDGKYCDACWEQQHPASDPGMQHPKDTFKFRANGATGKVQLSSATSPAEALDKLFSTRGPARKLGGTDKSIDDFFREFVAVSP
ncbi:hypothetical protein DIPPA_32701 [Diplonema papillatum]|nr:hypothetical protein DIPPA_32701 [Diplonema papillatum]